MKRGIFFVFITLILCFLVNPVLSEIEITGKATAQNTNLSIIVDTGPPEITILSPLNQSYTLNNISLNFSVYDYGGVISSRWYNLNEGDNFSVLGNSTIYASSGSYKLRVYANDSVNYINYSEIHFYINSSLGWDITTVKYNGTTTNFTALKVAGKLAMQSIADFTLEIVGYGKIVFLDNINITRDIDLDPYSSIDSNLVYINSASLSELNKSARITLTNLNFSTPRILKDGILCSASECISESYTNGTLIFTVEEAASYTSEETPSSDPSGGGGGGGGGTSGEDTNQTPAEDPAEEIKIEFDKSGLTTNLFPGQAANETIKLTNGGDGDLNITIIPPKSLEKFVVVRDLVFLVRKGETKEIVIEFFVKEDEIPESIYSGKFIFISEGLREELPVLVGVESKNFLIDLKLEIDKRSKEIKAGEELYFKMIMEKKKNQELSLNLTYRIIDKDGFTVFKNNESILLDSGNLELERDFIIPLALDQGVYFLSVTADYGDGVLIASDIFEISMKENRISLIILLIIVSICVLVFLLIVYIKRKDKKMNKDVEDIEEIEKTKKRTI